MPLEIETVGNVKVVTLEGKLVTEAAQDLKCEFDAYVGGAPGPTLLEMSGVKYISSYLVGVFVVLRTRLVEKGLALHFAGLDPRHRLVLRISGLESLFEYHATREDGIAALEAGGGPRGD
jgi:anti-anti-sigma factor